VSDTSHSGTDIEVLLVADDVGNVVWRVSAAPASASAAP